MVYLTKEELYRKIDDIRGTFNITLEDYPINILNLCGKQKNISIEYASFKSKQLYGMSFKGNINNTIIINSSKPDLEYPFICGHELIHIKLHPYNELGYTCFENPQDCRNSYYEWHANEGSAELLVPYKILLPLIQENYNELITNTGIYEFCEEKALFFGVSPIVIHDRINSLAYEIEQYLNGCELEKIKIISLKAQQEQGINVKSLNQLETERINSFWTKKI